MKTFKQYMIENSNFGNYVAIDCQDLSDFFQLIGVAEPVSGEAPPKGDYHCTLIYSEKTDFEPDRILTLLEKTFNDQIEAKVKGIECFDSLPKDGSRDAEKSCLVLKLSNTDLTKIHECLKRCGLKHSYDDFSPHVTLRYNMSVHEAHYYKDKLNDLLSGNPMTVDLSNFKSQKINKNYV